MLGLVAGFPLLLLCFMLSLEKLESWGLREPELPPEQQVLDRVDAAVEQVEQLNAAGTSLHERQTIEHDRAVGAQRSRSGRD